MLGGIGMGLAGAGGVLSAYGNYKSGRKAQKNLQNAMNQARNNFITGSTDAQGNKISWDKDKGWNYTLSNVGNAEKNIANKATYLAQAMQNQLPSVARNVATAQDYNILNRIAKANQSAANINALRTGGNVGDISRTYSRQMNSDLLNSIANNIRQRNNAQTERLNDYVNAAMNAKQMIQNTQNQLQNLHNTLGNRLYNIDVQNAQIAGTPKQNWMQLLGGIGQGLGQGVGELGKQRQSSQLLQTLLNNLSQNKENSSNPELLTALLQILGG